MICCQIRSDKDRQAKVEYYITGPGANKPPINLFVVDHDTGFVRITDIVDREKYPFFNVSDSFWSNPEFWSIYKNKGLGKG